MSRKQLIEARIRDALVPTVLEVADESHRHSVPVGSESHFNVMVVSAAFEGDSRVERHRRIHRLLASELEAGLHALTLTLLTPKEHETKGALRIESPECLGGSKSKTSG